MKHIIRIYHKLFIAVCFGVIITSCGFHLRGQGPNVGANIENSRVYLAVTNSNGLLHRQILRDLQFSQAKVIDEPAKADWHIIILSVKTEKKSVGIDSSGRSNEYEIILDVEYIVDSAIRLKQVNQNVESKKSKEIENRFLTSHRNFYFDNNDPIGKRNEEKILLDSMRKDISRQLVSVLSSSIANQ